MDSNTTDTFQQMLIVMETNIFKNINLINIKIDNLGERVNRIERRLIDVERRFETFD